MSAALNCAKGHAEMFVLLEYFHELLILLRSSLKVLEPTGKQFVLTYSPTLFSQASTIMAEAITKDSAHTIASSKDLKLFSGPNNLCCIKRDTAAYVTEAVVTLLPDSSPYSRSISVA